MTEQLNILKELYELKMNRETIIREKILGPGPVLYTVTPSCKDGEGPKLRMLKWFTSLKSAVEYGDILKTLEEDDAAIYIYINILLDDGKSIVLKKEELSDLLDLEKEKE
jgi:hypothetical protein